MERERKGKATNEAEKDGIRKAALFLSILDAEAADALLARFEPNVARAIEAEARRVENVASEDVDAIVAEFLALSEPEEPNARNGQNGQKERSAQNNEERAKEENAFFNVRTNAGDDFQPLDAIETERLARILSGAGRTTVAIALTRLSERRRAAVVALLPPEKAEGARRALSALVRTTDAVRRLEDALFNGALDDE